MLIRALFRTFAAGVLIIVSADVVAASTTGRQATTTFAESTMPTWTQVAQTMLRVRPLMAQLSADSRGEQAARIRAQMEWMEARARASDRLNGRVQPRGGGDRGDWQQQEHIRQEYGSGDRGD